MDQGLNGVPINNMHSLWHLQKITPKNNAIIEDWAVQQSKAPRTSCFLRRRFLGLVGLWISLSKARIWEETVLLVTVFDTGASQSLELMMCQRLNVVPQCARDSTTWNDLSAIGRAQKSTIRREGKSGSFKFTVYFYLVWSYVPAPTSRCHPQEALYLPTFSHLFDCQ